MAGTKRPLASSDAGTAKDVHPSRKRRMQYSEAHAQQAKIYNDLADHVQALRLKAAESLLKTLSIRSSDQVSNVSDALTRLIKGLCSGRKAARIGFSVALSEVLRLAFDLASNQAIDELQLEAVVEKIANLTQPEIKGSGQEKRDCLLGRRFAFQAVLQSNATQASNRQWRTFVRAIVDLAGQKEWLRNECGMMLYEYLESVDGQGLSEDFTLIIIDELHKQDVLKTPEGVAIWLQISTRLTKDRFPKGIWHDGDPLSSKESVKLKKMLHGGAEKEKDSTNGFSVASGTRQSQPSFAWKVILSHLYSRKHTAFEHFWKDVVDDGLFATSASAERKALGLQIVSIGLSTAPKSQLVRVLSENVLRCIINQRADAERYLFEASKSTLNQAVQRAKLEPSTDAELVRVLLDVGGINFDQITKTKTIETILQQVDASALEETVTVLGTRMKQPGGQELKEVELQRRTIADILLGLVRSRNEPAQLFKSSKKSVRGSQTVELMPWLHSLFSILLECCFCDIEDPSAPSSVSQASQSLLRTRLMSCLGTLLHHPLDQAVCAPMMVVKRLCHVQPKFRSSASKDVQKAMKQSEKHLDQCADAAGSAEGAEKATAQAYQLLFALSMLQVFNEEPEGVEVLKDLGASYQTWEVGGDPSSMMVEILLSFVSKPSALFRKLAEQVFTTITAELTAESLESLIDILGQKESLSGQQELFDQHHGDDGVESEGAMEVDGIDLEDLENASDVELVDEDDTSSSDEEEDDGSAGDYSSSSSSSSKEDAESSDGESEEAAFDRKLADALGTTGMDHDSDDDGSDMDDEQMLALEPHLTSIFQQRSKPGKRKQDNKDAKDNMVNFKNRVLDLLAIYVKKQYANALALDLILPLTELVRTTSSKATSEKAFAVLKQYFEACSKNKSLPEASDGEAVSELVSAVHAEMKLGGSKLHANACSRSSLFLAKVLLATDQTHYRRIAELYAELQSEWYLDPKSKVQGSVFTEWTSWSLATRKQK